MKRFILRLFSMTAGLFMFAVGVVLAIRANIGYAPWEVLHVGMSKTLGWSIGFASIAAGMVILLVVTILKEKFGLGTISCIVLTGIFIDVIINADIIPQAKNFPVGVLMLVAGLFVLSFGTFFYMSSAFGAGPRDNLMVALRRKTKLPVGVCRSAIEFAAAVGGWFMGGMLGAGTLISVFGLGFCIQVTFKLLKFDPTAVKHETLADTYAFLFGKKTGEKY